MSVMTRQVINPVCDVCAKEVTSEQRYRFDINQAGGVKGKFVKCDNSADMCHECFLKICTNGFKPKWICGTKNDQTGKWDWVEGDGKYETKPLQ